MSGKDGPLVSLPPPQEAAVVEHVLSHWIQGPVIALSGVAGLAGNLDEAVVKAVDLKGKEKNL